MSSTRSCFRRVELRSSAPDVAQSSRLNPARRTHRARPNHQREQPSSQSRAPTGQLPRCLAPSPHPGDRSDRRRPRRVLVRPLRPRRPMVRRLRPRRLPQPRLRPRGQELNCSRRRNRALRHRQALHAPGPRSSVRRSGHPLRRPPETRRESGASRESGARRESEVSRSLIALRQLQPSPRPRGRLQPRKCRSTRSTRRPGQGERRSSARLPCPPRSLPRSFSPPRRHSGLRRLPPWVGMPRLEVGRFSSRAGPRLSGELPLPQTRWVRTRQASLRCLASSPFRGHREAQAPIRLRWSICRLIPPRAPGGLHATGPRWSCPPHSPSSSRSLGKIDGSEWTRALERAIASP